MKIQLADMPAFLLNDIVTQTRVSVHVSVKIVVALPLRNWSAISIT